MTKFRIILGQKSPHRVLYILTSGKQRLIDMLMLENLEFYVDMIRRYFNGTKIPFLLRITYASVREITNNEHANVGEFRITRETIIPPS